MPNSFRKLTVLLFASIILLYLTTNNAYSLKYSYDINGRLDSVRVIDGEVVNYHYDRNGNLLNRAPGINTNFYYKIQSQKSGKYLDIPEDSLADGVSLQQWSLDSVSPDNQTWKFEYVGNGYYQIQAKHSRKVLDVPQSHTQDETTIVQFEANNGDNQLWRLIDAGGGYFIILAKHSGKVMSLNPSANAAVDGVTITQQPRDNGQAQKWKLIQDKEFIHQDYYYQIQSKKSGKYLDINNNSLSDGTLLHQWDLSSGDNQKWRFEYAGNGYYKIRVKHSGKVLDVTDSQQHDGADIIQFLDKGTDNQLWKITYTGEGDYIIQAKHSRKALDLNLASDFNANGVKVQQWTPNAGDNQKWKLIRTEPVVKAETYYRIQSRISGKYLDIAGDALADGTQLQQWDLSGGDNQKWKFEYAGNGYYKIRVKHSGKVISVTDSQMHNGANVVQWSDYGGNNQLWRLEGAGQGFYFMRVKHSGKILDLNASSNSSINDAKVIQWNFNGGDNQKWKFIQA